MTRLATAIDRLVANHVTLQLSDPAQVGINWSQLVQAHAGAAPTMPVAYTLVKRLDSHLPDGAMLLATTAHDFTIILATHGDTYDDSVLELTLTLIAEFIEVYAAEVGAAFPEYRR